MECGRVARGEARFCQCGASLVRTCHWCYREVPVDHPRCDICGWLDPGFGIRPAIEGRWKTFLTLLPYRLVEMGVFGNENVQRYLALFKSVWDDSKEGPLYHRRYQEILEVWKFDWPSNADEKKGYFYGTAIRFFDGIFAKVGEPMIDSLVCIALQADERAIPVVVLLRHLAGEPARTYLCSQAARGALVTLVANKRAAAPVRGAAAESLGKIYAVRELVALADGQDGQAAILSMTALEASAWDCYGSGEHIAVLRRSANREIAARAKVLLKKIDRAR
jgi:hypothetical protein